MLPLNLHSDAFGAGCSSNASLSRLVALCASPAADRGVASVSSVQMLQTRFRVVRSFLALLAFEWLLLFLVLGTAARHGHRGSVTGRRGTCWTSVERVGALETTAGRGLNVRSSMFR